MKEWLTALVPENWQLPALWCAAAALIVIFWLFSRVYRRWLHPALLRLLGRRGRSLPAVLADGFSRPLTHLLALVGWRLAANVAPIGPSLTGAIHTLWRLAIVVLCGWGLAGGQLIPHLLTNACRRLDENTRRSVVSFATSLFKGVVWALVAVIVLSELGYDVNGLLAGLGLGGLTVALAAQESAANFFAGLVLVLERPFEVGDFITYGELSGTVEAIAFRASRLRTMADTVITVPNSVLASSPITNWGRMRRRLVRFSIGLRYDTAADTLQTVLGRLNAMLQADESVLPETAHAQLEGFGDSSINLLIRYYIGKPDFEHQFEVNQRINFAIIQIVHDCGADFAFPSRSLYLETPVALDAQSPISQTSETSPLSAAFAAQKPESQTSETSSPAAFAAQKPTPDRQKTGTSSSDKT